MTDQVLGATWIQQKQKEGQLRQKDLSSLEEPPFSIVKHSAINYAFSIFLDAFPSNLSRSLLKRPSHEAPPASSKFPQTHRASFRR